ncbi:hypothetical protein CAAN1_06S01948 [[Candida] anglica]|uniref:Uncharacterized protein n=1 Tax=[Candida] anglica TaxID=148631 RepID=A0ABP0ELH4_9ASCO
MSFLLKTPISGLLTGLMVPPVLTKLVLEPVLIQKKYDEIDKIKHDLDFVGWHVRNLEESYGFKEADVYIPVSYFQGRY